MSRMELAWRPSFSASCIHAADAVASGAALVEPRLSEAIVPPAHQLREEIRATGIPESRFWRNLLALSHQLDNNRELATAALRKTISGTIPEAWVSRLSGRIADLESVVQQAVPQLLDELQLRIRPLREQWEAYGPGLLHSLARRTDEGVLAERAEVILVLPVCGGGGAAHLSNNSVRIEAVLANPLVQLPEFVRLGWFLSQLQLDLPRFSECIPADRLPQVAALAMIPPVLLAAAELECIRPDMATLPVALAGWLAADDRVALTVSVWWETYLASPTSWATALAALDRLLMSDASLDECAADE